MIAKRRRTGRFAALNMDFPHTVATSVGLEGWGGVAGTQDGAVEPIQRPILLKAETLCFEPQDLCTACHLMPLPRTHRLGGIVGARAVAEAKRSRGCCQLLAGPAEGFVGSEAKLPLRFSISPILALGRKRHVLSRGCQHGQHKER